MADDSEYTDEPFDFHPTNIPSGTKNYNLQDLTVEQQTKLNALKQEEIKNDHKYLNKHPEVRGLLVMILKILMRERPSGFNLYEIVAKYFTKPSNDIRGEIEAYLTEKKENVNKNNTKDKLEELESLILQNENLLPQRIKSAGATENDKLLEDEPKSEDNVFDDVDDEINIFLNIEDVAVDYDDHVIRHSSDSDEEDFNERQLSA